MNKYYLTFVLTDKPHAIEINTIEDHLAAGPVEFAIGGEGIGLFRLLLTFFNLKYLLQDLYKKLYESKN